MLLLLVILMVIGAIFHWNSLVDKQASEKAYSSFKIKSPKNIGDDNYDSIFKEMQQMLSDMNKKEKHSNDKLNIKQYNSLDPNGPTPTILMSLGRSGSGSTWQIMGNLTGHETPSTEYTGSSTRKSEQFFEKVGTEDEGAWLIEYLSYLQRKYATSGIVGFKWKPYSTIFSEPAMDALHVMSNSVNPTIRVVRLRRNLLDVIISRSKHSIYDVRSHCIVGDTECLKQHSEAAMAGVELHTKNLLRQLEQLSRLEDAVDQLLVKFNILHVHVSFENLYMSNHDNVSEWLKLLQFLDVGEKQLTKEQLIQSMRHVGTSNTKQSDTINNIEDVRNTLYGTKFENLLH